jgi:hypothetical protein
VVSAREDGKETAERSEEEDSNSSNNMNSGRTATGQDGTRQDTVLTARKSRYSARGLAEKKPKMRNEEKGIKRRRGYNGRNL